MSFLQQPPQLPDSWTSDKTLQAALRWHLGDDTFAEAEPQLAEMGRRATSQKILELARQAEREPPVHIPYSTWGERIDEIRVSSAYTDLGKIGVRAGVASIPYEDGPFADKARIVWAGVMALWGPSSALYSCPIAMTDAAARTLLVHGGHDDLAVVEHLTSRDPDYAWTSGQWMTETAGGSDVGRTGTVARRDDQGAWRLYGTKWFTSATTSELALTLARPEGAPEGARGLALFRIHRMLEDGSRNAIVVRRLKDKLGTRALPTAELELEGALAFPIGDPADGGGVRRISTMLNITRIHNSLGAVGALSRGLAYARAYARVREVFGRPLHTMPAHRATLADLAVDHAAALALTLRCSALTGKVEQGAATDDETALLRGLTPVSKLATARWAIAGATEAMEALGGVGYCEDSSMPAVVRNAHVLPIWEGTTNVLALDLLRAAIRNDALRHVFADAERSVAPFRDDPHVRRAAASVTKTIEDLRRRVDSFADQEAAERGARSLALGVATTYACAELVAQAGSEIATGSTRTASIADRLAARGLTPPEPPRDLALGMDEIDPVAGFSN